MKSIIIVGGSGFIGTRLLYRLLKTRNPDELLVIDKVAPRVPDVPYTICDIRDRDRLLDSMEPAGTLINLAAEHKDNVHPRTLYDEVNVVGSANLCHAAETHGIEHIVFTSSVAVYGFAPRNTAEDGEIAYFNDYGRTKWEAEEVYRRWHSGNPGRKLNIVRPTVVFGEQNRGNVYNLLRQIVEGPFIMIGRGENRKSMAYVENVAAFIQFCAESGETYSVHNYVDKPDKTMMELVQHVRELIGLPPAQYRRIPYWIGYTAGASMDLLGWMLRKQFSISAIRVKKFVMDTLFASGVEETGFQAPVSLEEGLERTIRHEFLERHTGPVFESE